MPSVKIFRNRTEACCINLKKEKNLKNTLWPFWWPCARNECYSSLRIVSVPWNVPQNLSRLSICRFTDETYHTDTFFFYVSIDRTWHNTLQDVVTIQFLDLTNNFTGRFCWPDAKKGTWRSLCVQNAASQTMDSFNLLLFRVVSLRWRAIWTEMNLLLWMALFSICTCSRSVYSIYHVFCSRHTANTWNT